MRHNERGPDFQAKISTTRKERSSVEKNTTEIKPDPAKHWAQFQSHGKSVTALPCGKICRTENLIV